MSCTYDVIVYGTICLDAIWRVRALPPPGGYVPIQEERKMVGGEAANTAIALARWGVRVALIGNGLGDDEDGRLLRRLFAEQTPEIDTRFLKTSSEWHTPFCLCIATPDGHRTMFGRGFSEMQCPPLDPELARSARIFTVEPNAWEAGQRACAVAAEAGMSIVAMDYTRVPAINRVATISVTSTDHIGPDKTVEELCIFAANLRDEYGMTTIVTNGARGCFVAASGGEKAEVAHVPAYVVPEILDTTGAGDIFRAGLIYGQLQNWELLQTVRFASAAAALNCTALGGWGGVRPVEVILAFQQSYS